jgi:hypothetical protein
MERKNRGKLNQKKKRRRRKIKEKIIFIGAVVLFEFCNLLLFYSFK